MATELERGDEDIARQFYERAWNDADESAVDELLAEDFFNHELPVDNGQPHRERYKQAIRDTFTAFPDWKIDVYEIGGEVRTCSCDIAAGERILDQAWESQWESA